MIELVISGGQTGVDQAGWRAAKACGIPTRGWMPKGWLTEVGPRPEFETLYNAQEHESPEYPPRTMANVLSADATIWIGRNNSPGYGCTIKACKKGPRPFFVIHNCVYPPIREVKLWINAFRFKVINIAGSRESKYPGIGESSEKYLTDLFNNVNNT